MQVVSITDIHGTSFSGESLKSMVFAPPRTMDGSSISSSSSASYGLYLQLWGCFHMVREVEDQGTEKTKVNACRSPAGWPWVLQTRKLCLGTSFVLRFDGFEASMLINKWTNEQIFPAIFSSTFVQAACKNVWKTGSFGQRTTCSWSSPPGWLSGNDTDLWRRCFLR